MTVPKLRPDEPALSGTRFSERVWDWVHRVTVAINGPPVLPEYTVAGLPDAAGAKRLVWVMDAGGGPVPAYSDGTTWRRVTDGTEVS